MANLVDFRSRFSELSDVDDAVVQVFLDESVLYMGVDDGRWLEFYDTAHLYLTAHYVTVSSAAELGDTSALAPVKKQGVDDVIVESAIADSSADFDELLGTTYGKRYYNIRFIVFGGVRGI